MLPSPMEDSQLAPDLPSDFVFLPNPITVPAPTRRSSRVRNKPQRLIEEL